MSRNPTYDPEPGYDQPAYDPYAENTTSPPQQDFSNMASYRQATVGPPSGGMGVPDNGKSYRYATEAIPEDEEESPDGQVHYTNGRQPSKTHLTTSESKSSSGSFWSRHGMKIVIALAVLFAILFVIFLALYVQNAMSTNETQNPVKEEQVNTRSTMSVTSTTTAPLETGKEIGDYKGTKVRQFMLTNNQGMEVELLSLGARINSMKFNNKDIVLGFDTTNGSLANMAKYVYGSANGRICGDVVLPITLGSQGYNPDMAEGETVYSEGGAKGLFQVNFDGEQRGNSVTFTTTATENDDKLPGTADISVTYTLEGNKLHVSMEATSQQDSLIDMCNSVRFNLNGDGSSIAPNHELMVNAKRYYDLMSSSWRPVTGGAADFRQLTNIETNIEKITVGTPDLARFQYSYELSGATGMRLAGMIRGPDNTQVKIHTNQPVARISVETASGFSVQGKAQQPYGPYSSVSFITHGYARPADRVNMLLESSSTYKSEIMYSLS